MVQTDQSGTLEIGHVARIECQPQPPPRLFGREKKSFTPPTRAFATAKPAATRASRKRQLSHAKPKAFPPALMPLPKLQSHSCANLRLAAAIPARMFKPLLDFRSRNRHTTRLADFAAGQGRADKPRHAEGGWGSLAEKSFARSKARGVPFQFQEHHARADRL